LIVSGNSGNGVCGGPVKARFLDIYSRFRLNFCEDFGVRIPDPGQDTPGREIQFLFISRINALNLIISEIQKENY
jgi:hypothetical protein